MEKSNLTSSLHAGSCKRFAASLSGLVGRVVLAAAAGFLMLPEARAGEYYWKDWAGANGRWDWGTSQWWYNGGYAVGKPATDGSAMVFFQDTGSTTTYINAGATSGYFLLNAIFTSDNSTRAYVINTEGGISGVGLYNKIETLSGGGSLTFNCDVKLYATAEINAVGASLTLANLLMNGQTLSSYGSNSLNITGVMSGSGTYNIKNYGITVTYSGSGANTFGGTTTVESSSTLVLNKSANTAAIAGQLTINSAATLRTDAAGQMNNQYVVVNGAFNLNNNSQSLALAGSGNVTLGTSTLTNYNLGTDAFSGVISGSGAVVKSGTGTLALSGNNSYTGATTVSAGVLQATHANALGGASNGTTVESGAALELSGSITVGEALTLTGGGISYGGALRNTSGNNFSTGDITLGPWTGITSDAGTLTLNGSIAGGSNVLYPGGSGNIVVNGVISGDGAYEAEFSKTSSLIKNGGGTLTLSGNNTYTGATTVKAGVLKVTQSNALGTTAGDTTVIAGGVLELSGNITIAEPLTLNGDGISYGGALRNTSGDNTSTGAITLGSSSRINSDAGTLTLNSAIAGGANTLYIGGAGNTTINGVITGNLTTGNGALYKDGAGTLTLTGNNSSALTGLMELKGGTISIGNINGLTSGALQIGGGNTSATLAVTDNISTGHTINVLDASTAGAINVADGKNFTLTGGLGGGATNTTKYGKIGNGTLTLGGVNTYGGQVQIGEGTVIGTSNSAFGTNASTAARAIDLGLNVGDVSMGNNVAVYITDTVTNNSSIYVAPNTSSATRSIGLSGTGNATFHNEIYLDGNVTLTGGSGSVTFTGNFVKNTANAGGGIIASGGTVTLTGTNTYVGATVIYSGATLQLGNGSTTGNLSSSSAITNNGTLVFNRSNTITQGTDFASVISGTGSLTQNSAGGTLTLSGNNTYTGATTISAGVLHATHANALGSTANGTTVASGTALEVSGGITIAEALTLDGYGIADGGALRSTGGNNYLTGNIALGGWSRINSDAGMLTLNGTVAVDANLLYVGGAGNMTVNGAISGFSGVLIKDGNGTLTLSGANTYTGNATVAAGILHAASANALGTTDSGTTVIFNAALEVSGGITIGEELVLNGTGISDGSLDRGALRGTGGNNFMTGNITLGSHWNRINSDAGTLILNGTIAGDSNILYIGGNGSITIAGALSGAGYTQDGTTTCLFKDWTAGTLTLSGNNTYTGDTRINGGTITVAAGGTLGVGSDVFISGNSTLNVNASTEVASVQDWASGNAGTVAIGSGATLTMDGTGSATFSGVLGGAGGLAKAGSGTLTLNGTNTYTGATTVAGGTLQANAANALGSNSGITVNTGGTLLVSANGSLGSSTAITMNSTATGNGTAASLVFSSSYNGTVGALVLDANSIFDLGSDPLGVQVHFSSISGLDTYTLSIYNWTGTTLWEGGTGNNLDQIYAGNELSDSELAHISFYSGLDTSSFRGTGYQIMSGSFLNELGPVPEPATWVAMVALVFGGGLCAFRRRIQGNPDKS